MENTVRRYITRVLALNLAFLLAVVAVVALAGQAVYQSAQSQAEAAALERLRQPANQSADAIGRHFAGVFATLDVDLLSLNASTLPASPDAAVLPSALWTQLRSRISDLLVLELPPDSPPILVHRFTNVPSLEGDDPFPDDMNGVIADDEAVARLLKQSARWLGVVRENATPSLSDPVTDVPGIMPAVMTAVVVRSDSSTEVNPRMLIGLVPLAYIESSFILTQLQPERLGLLLVDSRANVVCGTSTPLIVGANTAELAVQGRLPPTMSRFILDRVRGRSIAPEPFVGQVRLGTLEFDETLAMMTPVPLLGRQIGGEIGASITPATTDDVAVDSGVPETDPNAAPQRLSRTGQLWVVALLNREEVVKPLEDISRTALLWAIGLIVAVTAILVSSSVQLIKGRGRLERLRTEMVDKELREARSIQLRWLPKDETHIAGHRLVEIAAQNVPASHISGDFYNYFDLPNSHPDDGPSSALAIGDVTGHGIAAAFLMSTTQLLIQNSLERSRDPATTLAEVNNLLSRQATGGQFVTLLLGVLDVSAQRLNLASAGHAGPLACDANGTWREMEIDGDLVLGVLADSEYSPHSIALDGARALLFYTDGAVEVVNQNEERFDLPSLVEQMTIEMPGGPSSAKEVVDAALRVVRTFANGEPLGDDVTLLAVYLSPVPGTKPDIAKTSSNGEAGNRL